MEELIMKKIFALLLSCMMILSIAACGNGKYVGTWELEKAEMEGQEVTADMIGEMILEFEKGGKGSLTAAGQDADFEWEVKDGKLSMTHDGDTIETEVEVKGDTLVLDDFDGAKMTFKKK